MEAPSFLADFLRPVPIPEGSAFGPVGLALGQGPSPLEVLVVTCSSTPGGPAVRSFWHAWNNERAAPLVTVILHDGKATLCGAAGDKPPLYKALDAGQVERICREALSQPNRHAAQRYLDDAMPSFETCLPGLRNAGLLATHQLTSVLPRTAQWRDAWTSAGEQAQPLLNQRGEALLRSMSFHVEPYNQAMRILRTVNSDQKVAVAILLHPSESSELQADRFSKLSPVEYALTVADRENLPYVVVQQGTKLRLYPVKSGVGVARRAWTDTYIQIDTVPLREAHAAYLWLIFSAEALTAEGTLAQLLDDAEPWPEHKPRRQGRRDSERRRGQPLSLEGRELGGMKVLESYGRDRWLLECMRRGWRHYFPTRSLKRPPQRLCLTCLAGMCPRALEAHGMKVLEGYGRDGSHLECRSCGWAGVIAPYGRRWRLQCMRCGSAFS